MLGALALVKFTFGKAVAHGGIVLKGHVIAQNACLLRCIFWRDLWAHGVPPAGLWRGAAGGCEWWACVATPWCRAHAAGVGENPGAGPAPLYGQSGRPSVARRWTLADAALAHFLSASSQLMPVDWMSSRFACQTFSSAYPGPRSGALSVPLRLLNSLVRPKGVPRFNRSCAAL
eukprot:GHVR01071949.1.p1 GENE.GHVR01071949.1~~GHVR01071949.1.p1  ORF type:complete len:174 (+),score=14.28 GHVR01071949.1:779-1300(+)